jgi:hypothetical protein
MRPERARRIPSALSGRIKTFVLDTQGVALGWHPPRRWREIERDYPLKIFLKNEL